MGAPEQLVLISEPRHRASDPDTSRIAAETVKPGHAGRLQRIAEIVDEAGYRGCTRDEVFQRVVLEQPNAHQQTISGAVSQCLKAGLIVERGKKHTRLSLRNQPQEIYITPRFQEQR